MTPRDTRSVDLEIEVPGSPEQVWDAIATGPGLSVWFVPCDVEEREGGTVTMHHGGGFDQTATVTDWDPPRRFAFETAEWQPSPEASAQTVALELLVEARAGGTCVVRLVNSGFGSDAAWDDQLESTRAGWLMCLRALRVYLTHFPGERSARFVAFGSTAGPKHRAWEALTGTLGLDAPAAGERVRVAAPDAPALAGVVDHAGPEMLLVLDEPTPGIGSVSAGGPGDLIYVSVSASLFGDEAPAAAARAQDAWQAWMDERFPMPATTP